MEFKLWEDTEKHEYNGSEIEIPFSAKDVIVATMPPVAKGGYTLADMVLRRQILGKLSKVEGDKVELTNQEAAFLVKRLDCFVSKVASENLLLLRQKLYDHAVSNSNKNKNKRGKC